MGKLSAAGALAGVGGTGAAGTCIAHSLGAFGGEKGEAPKGWDVTLGEKTDPKTENINKCLQEIFPNWNPHANSPATVDSLSDIQWDSSSSPTYACLVFNWTKEKKENNYIGSKFRLVWTMSKGDVGVAVDLYATVKLQSELEFSGFSYLLGKDKGQWKATKKLGLKEATDNKKIISTGDWKSKFPKLEQSSFSSKTIPEYWGFLDASGGNIQAPGDLTNQQWWKWNPNTSSGFYKLKDWSSNFDNWWNHFFGKERLDMKSLMEKCSEERSWNGS